MTEQLGHVSTAQTSMARINHGLAKTLIANSAIGLRDSVSTIIWDAHEHADWMSTQAVMDSFDDTARAESSVRYGADSFKEPMPADVLLGHFDSERFHKFKSTISEKVKDPDVRSLVFFNLGVKLGATALRQKPLF